MTLRSLACSLLLLLAPTARAERVLSLQGNATGDGGIYPVCLEHGAGYTVTVFPIANGDVNVWLTQGDATVHDHVHAPAASFGYDVPGDGPGCVYIGVHVATTSTIGFSLWVDKTRPAPSQAPSRIHTSLLGFSLRLHGLLAAAQPGNLVWSPASVAETLSMTIPGAKGETRTQLLQGLGLDAATVDEELLQSVGAQAKAFDASVKMANRLVVQTGLALEPGFTNLLTQQLAAAPGTADFAANPEAARQDINNWVSLQTDGGVPELLPQGSIDSLTRLVAVDAVRFADRWLVAFDPAKTYDGDFHTDDGRTVTTKLMSSAETSLRFGQTDTVQVVELPYGSGKLAMLVVMPQKGHHLAELTQALTPATVGSWLEILQHHQETLVMPRFEATTAAALGDPGLLPKLGIVRPFVEGEADFSGITHAADLYLTSVQHAAAIAVDEAGTTASAATAAVSGVYSAELPVTIDRPFLYLIRDTGTGALLFMGQYTGP